MRKSQVRGGSRAFRTGVAAAATAAAVVAGTATSAWAATSTITTNWSQIPTQGGLLLTVTDVGFFAANSPYAGRLIGGTSPSCGTSAPAANLTATNPVVDTGTITATGNDTATLVTPAVAAGAWKLCIYDAAANVASTAGTLNATPFGTLNNASGTSTVTNAITLTSTGAFTGTSFGTEFSTTTCPDKYATPSGTAVVAASALKASTGTLNITAPATLAAATPYYVCVYNGTLAGSSTIVARTQNTYATFASTLPSATVSPTNGSSGATNANITLTTTTGTIPTTGTLGSIFTRNSCPASNASLTGDQIAGVVTRISTAKVAVAVPTGVVSGPRDATTPWNVCLYNPQNALILAPAVYTVAPPLDLSGIFNTNGNNLGGGTTGQTPSVNPTGGPAQGGTTITISNLSGIPTADGSLLTVSLGGSPLTNVKAIDATSLSGVTSAHAPGPVNLSITTAAGTKTTTFSLADTTTNAGVFNYAYAINVTPNTAPPVTAGTTANSPTLDITGAGFSNLSFADVGSGTNASAHVLLVSNSWYNQPAGGNNLTTGTGLANPFAVTDAVAGTVAPVTQCMGVMQITDNEIICTLDLGHTITGNSPYSAVAMNGTAVSPGAYTVTVINNGGSAALLNTSYNYSVISSGATFTVSTF